MSDVYTCTTGSGGSLGFIHYAKSCDGNSGVGKPVSHVNAPDVPVPCPKCNGRAVRAPNGTDWLIDAIDHNEGETVNGVLKLGKPNGSRFRLRLCSQCGHLYASKVSASESPLAPGK